MSYGREDEGRSLRYCCVQYSVKFAMVRGVSRCMVGIFSVHARKWEVVMVGSSTCGVYA